MKDVRSSERREIFVLFRDSWLAEGWTRNKLERLTSLCKRKTYEAGEHLFRQGDAPDVLYVLFHGRVDLIKEIDLVCKNVLPVGPHTWQDRTRHRSKSILLKSVTGKGEYFGEVRFTIPPCLLP
jgi:CRP-like cAMP-binding protein